MLVFIKILMIILYINDIYLFQKSKENAFGIFEAHCRVDIAIVSITWIDCADSCFHVVWIWSYSGLKNKFKLLSKLSRNLVILSELI